MQFICSNSKLSAFPWQWINPTLFTWVKYKFGTTVGLASPASAWRTMRLIGIWGSTQSTLVRAVSKTCQNQITNICLSKKIKGVKMLLSGMDMQLLVMLKILYINYLSSCSRQLETNDKRTDFSMLILQNYLKRGNSRHYPPVWGNRRFN